MGRAPCCDKSNVKRGPWSPEEDELLKSYIENHGTGGNWISLPSKAGLRRCGKSCRLRWLNYLRPDIKHGKFSEEEDRVIFSLYNEIGSRWSIIAAKLHGRTDNDVKNHWNTKLKKLLIMKEHNTSSSEIMISNADQKSYSFAEFLNAKTETHQESMTTITNMLQGFSGYGSSLSFYDHEHVGYMVPTGLHLHAPIVSPSSIDSELSNGTSSINVGNFSWDNGRGSCAEDNGFLVDMLNYGEGVDNGCHLFQSFLETGDQKSGDNVELGSVAAVPSFSTMLSDDYYMYEFKPEGAIRSDHY